MLRLVVTNGEPAGGVFDLRAGTHNLGRSRSAAIRLGAADVSGTHAAIHVAADGSAEIENLSQFGTRINGAPVSGRAGLAAGQIIEVGNSTLLRVEAAAPKADEAAAGGSGAELPTGAGMSVADSAAAKPAFKPSFAAPAESLTRAIQGGSDDISELTGAAQELTTGGDDGEMATRAMQTRAAAPEELEHLRVVERRRGRRRLALIIGTALPLLLAALIFWPRQPPPELELEWSKDAAGNYLDRFEPAPSGGYKDDGYDICYPDNHTFARKATAGGVLLEGRIGRKLDVPLRIIVQEEIDKNLATLNRRESVAEWIEHQPAGGGRWNFDRPSPTPAFYGRRNGIPYTRVTYLRDGDGSWFGIANVICYGTRRIVARIEVPAGERMRAEKMMSVKLINPSQAFENAYWEGAPGNARMDEAGTLRQVRTDLERTAPATWAALEKLLQALLTQATLADNGEIAGEATALLVKLREMQSLYYNSQKLAFEAAKMQNNYVRAARVAEFTKAVFSNENDNRFFDVRKWRAEP